MLPKTRRSRAGGNPVRVSAFNVQLSYTARFSSLNKALRATGFPPARE